MNAISTRIKATEEMVDGLIMELKPKVLPTRVDLNAVLLLQLESSKTLMQTFKRDFFLPTIVLGILPTVYAISLGFVIGVTCAAHHEDKTKEEKHILTVTRKLMGF
ncbi:hypothetical protein FRX31_023596 [Thalictrum thalictroides]|uniref:Uncharacterized protein n=1 Tax=Thalictrum thalictroides TaxID=46969 RepID=A0A7J6VPY3_THATH|nr:hypothetical protein FRX31_023596 [Thalictrum thalictroides]